jgi:hypothetical protein
VVASKVQHIPSARFSRMIVHISNIEKYSLQYSCCYRIDEIWPDQQGNMERLMMKHSHNRKKGYRYSVILRRDILILFDLDFDPKN